MNNLIIEQAGVEGETVICPKCGANSIDEPCEHLVALDLGDIGGDTTLYGDFGDNDTSDGDDTDETIKQQAAKFPNRKFLQRNYNVDPESRDPDAIIRYVWDISPA